MGGHRLEEGKISPKWKDVGLAIGNKGLESNVSRRYLRQISFKINKEDNTIESRIFILEFSGLPSDTLLEKRYYKKTQ